MKKNLRKFFAVLLAVAMLASQITVPVFAATPAEGYCTVCKENRTLGALEHTIPATCQVGYEIYKCGYVDNTDPQNPVVCTGLIVIEIDPVDPHTPSAEPTPEAPASCTQTGTVEYYTCTVCEAKVDEYGVEIDAADLVIPMEPHDFDLIDDERADCLEDGYLPYYYCEKCDQCFASDSATNNPAVDPTVETAHGHDFSITHTETNSNCKDAGWYEYKECSICGELNTADGEIPYKPLANHGLGLKDHDDETCTEDGFNVFGCDESTCPYYWTADVSDTYEGITEVLTKTGHEFATQSANAATCYAPGNVAYLECTLCELLFVDDADEYEDPANAKDASYFATAQLVHTKTLVKFTPATCTETGLTSAIVCDHPGCGFVHYAAQIIEPTGHDFDTDDDGVEDIIDERVPTACNGAGTKEHKVCQNCNGKFKPDAEADETEEYEINYTADDHTYEDILIPATCDKAGTFVQTCTVLFNGVRCGHTKSESRPALGHEYEFKAKVDADCDTDGTAAHYFCDVCDCYFADNTDLYAACDPTYRPATETMLGHDMTVVVPAQKPTYDAAGNEEGLACSRCDYEDVTTIPELKETVKFYFDVVGVNGVSDLVNSGYVQVKIYFDVIAGDNDLEEYKSEVLANIFGIQLGLDYNTEVFDLIDVEHSGVFKMHSATNYAIADDPALNDGFVSITQDMGRYTSDAFTAGTYEVATLTFLVESDVDDTQFGTQTFELVEPYAVHKEDDTTANPYVPSIVVSSDSTTVLDVQLLRLGDANGDGYIKANDVAAVRDFVWDIVDGEYNTIYDLDKDGDVDYDDVNLLRDAVVGNNGYLDIVVDPTVKAPSTDVVA